MPDASDFCRSVNPISAKGAILCSPYCLWPPPGLSNYILRPCCLSVCPSVIECIQQEQKTFARATPPPLQSRQAQGCRTVWGYGELYPHQVLTEFQSLYPNDSQGFRLCPHQILRPSGGPVTGKLNFINFSVTHGLGFNFRWRSCRRLAAPHRKAQAA